MNAVWPADDLPLPLRDDFSRAGVDGRVRKQIEAGPVAYKRRYSLVPKLIGFSMFLSIDQVDRFWRFFEEECKGGALPFWMADPQRDGQPLLSSDGTPMLDADGVPYLQTVTKIYQFGDDMPAETPRGIDYKVAFGLVELP